MTLSQGNSWGPSDRRQQEIHRRLHLVGGEQAAFFRDACRLMDQDVGLLSTTHLVAHLLREVENGVADVLRPLAATWPEPGEADAHAKRIALLCTVLGIDDLAFPDLWRDYAKGLAGWAHRHAREAPRPVSPQFQELWEQGQAVLLHVTSRIEASYTLALPAAETLAAEPPNVRAFQQRLLHSPAVLDRFFERAGIQWLEPLRRAGAFSDPPPLAPSEDGTVRFVRWPPGAFLVRCAAEEPRTVVAIGLALNTDNPEAHQSLVDAALRMNGSLAAELSPQVEVWLSTTAQWQLPFKARDLAIHLVSEGQIEAGLSLFRTVVASLGFQRGHSMGVEIVRESADRLLPASGVAAIAMFAALLAEALASERSDGRDYSYSWRPSLDIESRTDLPDALITALVDGARSVVAEDPASLDATLAVLESHDLPVFRRLTLHLLAQSSNDDASARHLCDRSYLDDPNTEREYGDLLGARFAVLQPAARAAILGFVDDGPDWVENNEIADRWRLRMLSHIEPSLPVEWSDRYQHLLQRFGVPQVADQEPTAIRAARWSESPVTEDQLAAMTMPEVIEFLRSWTPPEDGWGAPTRAGLEDQLSRAAAGRPGEFAAAAASFLDLGPDYVRAVAGGLEEARRSGQSFPWGALLTLAEGVVDKPRAPRSEGGVRSEGDGWRSASQRMGHLICDGLRRDGDGISPSERLRVWGVITRLAQDEDPTPFDEASRAGSEFDPASLALNSLRGIALRTAVAYVWWLREPDDAEPSAMPSEARDLLNRHLDPDLEPSAAIRSVYGWFFPYLATADPQWAAENVSRIFPADSQRLWQSAWRSYVSFNSLWEIAFRLLPEQYARAVEDLPEGDPSKSRPHDPDAALINHLVIAVRLGLLSPDCSEGLLDVFFSRASVEQRAMAISRAGLHLMDEPALSDAERRRLMTLWECRLAAVSQSSEADSARELGGFGWWFASGSVDPEWSLRQLQEVMETGVAIGGERDVAERLEELLDDRPADVLRALESLVTASSEWFVYGAGDLLWRILERSLVGSEQDSGIGRDIVNRLVARGHADFARLL